MRHDIPSLDGLRAISIVIVVLSHSKSLLPSLFAGSGLFRYFVGGGLHGVQVFFVISGYLITTLLLREFERMGDISLKRFYARRMLRILPPFYAYLAVVAVLWAVGVSRQNLQTFLGAATYTLIYLPHPQGWSLQHAWSLSIEEQFYLLWPGLLLIARGRFRAARFAIVVLAVMPLIRASLALSATGGALNHDRLIVNLSSIDMLLAGCLLAILSARKGWRAWCERRMRGGTVAGLIAAGMLLLPYATTKLAGTAAELFLKAFGATVTALAIGAALEYVVRRPDSAAGMLLNTRLVRHVGVISYSIYMWQQLFTGNETNLGFLTYPLILIAAEISFWLIERPAMRLRLHFAF